MATYRPPHLRVNFDPISKLPPPIGKSRPYSFGAPQVHFDPFVYQTAAKHRPDIIRRNHGLSRVPRGTPGVYDSLGKFFGTGGTIDAEASASLTRGIASARSAFKLREKVHPLEWEDVGPILHKDTSAGHTFDGAKKGEVMEEIFQEARWLGHRMKQGGKEWDPRKVQFPYCRAGQRGSSGPPTKRIGEQKTRLVWVYPAEMLTIEGLYAPSLYDAYEKLGQQSPMLFGGSADKKAQQWIASRTCRKMVGLDFSGFDQTVNSQLIKVAFEIIHDQIQWDNWHGKPVTAAQRRRWSNLWKNMVWYFVNTPIAMPDGKSFRKSRGVPSGSFWTQLVDSIVNHILVSALCDLQGVECKDLRVLGDDSAFSTPDEFDLELAAEHAELLGMVMNRDKSQITCIDGEFMLLGYTYGLYGRRRPDDEWESMALCPSNPVFTLEQSMSRLVGLFLSGGLKSHSFCTLFADFQRMHGPRPYGKLLPDAWRQFTHVQAPADLGVTSKDHRYWKAKDLFGYACLW